MYTFVPERYSTWGMLYIRSSLLPCSKKFLSSNSVSPVCTPALSHGYLFSRFVTAIFTGFGVLTAAVWGQHTPTRVFCRLTHRWNSFISKDWWLSLSAFHAVSGCAGWETEYAAGSFVQKDLTWFSQRVLQNQFMLLSFIQFCSCDCEVFHGIHQ